MDDCSWGVLLRFPSALPVAAVASVVAAVPTGRAAIAAGIEELLRLLLLLRCCDGFLGHLSDLGDCSGACISRLLADSAGSAGRSAADSGCGVLLVVLLLSGLAAADCSVLLRVCCSCWVLLAVLRLVPRSAAASSSDSASEPTDRWSVVGSAAGSMMAPAGPARASGERRAEPGCVVRARV